MSFCLFVSQMDVTYLVKQKNTDFTPTAYPAAWLTPSPSCPCAHCGHSGWVFFSDSHCPIRAKHWHLFHLTTSKCIGWYHLVRTRHSRSCSLAPALAQLLHCSKPQKISSHYRINKQALIPQKKSSSLMMEKGGRKLVVGGEKLPQTLSPRRWGSVRTETQSIALHLVSSSPRSSAAQKSVFRVGISFKAVNNCISSKNVRQ